MFAYMSPLMHEWQYIKNFIAMNNFADITLLESCIIKRDIQTIIRHEALNIHILYHADCYCLGASEKREKSVGAWANFSFRPKKSPAKKKALLPKMSYMCVGRFSQHRGRFY
jgi:hypothetical protein